MSKSKLPQLMVGRRSLLKGAAIVGASQFAAPFAFGQTKGEPVKIGLDDPLTGTYAELGKNEQIGCELAVEEINKKGGILGRPVQLLVEELLGPASGVEEALELAVGGRDRGHLRVGPVAM